MTGVAARQLLDDNPSSFCCNQALVVMPGRTQHILTQDLYTKHVQYIITCQGTCLIEKELGLFTCWQCSLWPLHCTSTCGSMSAMQSWRTEET
jgi:hypothetical protein